MKIAIRAQTVRKSREKTQQRTVEMLEDRWKAWSEGEKDRTDVHSPPSQNARWVLLLHYGPNKHKLLPSSHLNNRWKRDEWKRERIQWRENAGEQRGKIKIYFIVHKGVFLFRFVWKCVPVRVCAGWDDAENSSHLHVLVCVSVRWVTNWRKN